MGSNEFDFAGQQTDGTGLQYLRARYYDPETGVFLSRDPLSSAPTWNANPFSYANGTPASLTDPSGLASIPFDPDGTGYSCRGWCPVLFQTLTFATSFGDLTFGLGDGQWFEQFNDWSRYRICQLVDEYPGGWGIGCLEIDPEAEAREEITRQMGNVRDDVLRAVFGVVGPKIIFGHGARHLRGTGQSQGEVENEIREAIRQSVAGASETGSFWGRVVVRGQTIEYRAHTLADGTINVGTYYPIP